jgi:hypothetical protein
LDLVKVDAHDGRILGERDVNSPRIGTEVLYRLSDKVVNGHKLGLGLSSACLEARKVQQVADKSVETLGLVENGRNKIDPV